MNESVFTILILCGLGIPIASYVILLLLGFFGKEFDYLQIENKKIEMEKELHRVEYLQLSQQIQPHFLFNSLNSMLSLSRLGRIQDVSHALEEFSQFIRYKYVEKESLVSFEKELTYTSHYISIQKIRFGNHLHIQYQIDEKAESTCLPPYILQTLVENAFKHGLEKKSGTKQLVISLARSGSWVTLSVSDNGPGIDVEKSGHLGVGLENIRKRLSLLFDLYTDVSLIRKNNITIAKAVWPYTPEG
ncbi:histidine kinase [Bacillus sp. FJAT-49736]|uniref:sensor histidine kinase n=1 Tax=Bacillus sp. FJAT-49736 TaxID=2833582 RepID=UPI001BC9AAC3|nr:histidine kinase [Bacillus sp. FJAT-49736]MBS4174824.1 histidine kinase [Bacillus sp. FJAT-49736]MBS4175519.1 histidine kinase [Bacillus sp. FJAT-49736]